MIRPESDAVIAFLNEVLDLDEAFLRHLLTERFPCNEAIAKHPSIQVWDSRDDLKVRIPEGEYRCSFLGLLNGYLGIFDDGPAKGCGPVMITTDDEGQIIKISRTDQREPEPSLPAAYIPVLSVPTPEQYEADAKDASGGLTFEEHQSRLLEFCREKGVRPETLGLSAPEEPVSYSEHTAVYAAEEEQWKQRSREREPSFEMETFCGHCNKLTDQTIEPAGHERDSSYDRQTCRECGWHKLGMSDEWFPGRSDDAAKVASVPGVAASDASETAPPAGQ